MSLDECGSSPFPRNEDELFAFSKAVGYPFANHSEFYTSPTAALYLLKLTCLAEMWKKMIDEEIGGRLERAHLERALGRIDGILQQVTLSELLAG